jgi:acetyl/propionyl-CoA carboxylase alpha subunit
MKLKKILVANRGEIALRIIKTIKEMGLEAVAMYVEIDKNSVYVQNSDHLNSKMDIWIKMKLLIKQSNLM